TGENRWARNQADLLRPRPMRRDESRECITGVGLPANHRRSAERVRIMTPVRDAVLGDTGPGGGVVFTFPAQGSYSYRVLRDLYASYPDTWPYFCQADEVTRRF